MKTYLSWRDVLDCDKPDTHNLAYFVNAIKLANKLNYTIILWNGWVWRKVESEEIRSTANTYSDDNEWVKTDKTVKNII